MVKVNNELGTAILQPLSTNEYRPPPRTLLQERAADLALQQGAEAAARLRVPTRAYWPSRRGTAAGLISLNTAAGDRFYEVSEQAALDDDAAEAAFASDGPVIDVQTHWIADRPTLKDFQNTVFQTFRAIAPEWWSGFDGLEAYSMAEYMRCVFVESETALAVISCAPGNAEGEMFLRNDEMAGMRELFDRMAGTGRLFNHTVVQPDRGDIALMPEWAQTYHPVGWKVYTMGSMDDAYEAYQPGSSWRLDDDETGMPFLQQAHDVGVKLVCSHKGLSGMVDAGSPSDVGPAAKAFPDITLVIYHSGYELATDEGPYTEETADFGINRLIKSVLDTGLRPGCNVYAELGATWFNLVSKPESAAHTLGKLLMHLGEDNIIWGTDSIWYGPTQPVIDSFRAFQIPDAFCERYGYPKISPEAKRKILAANAAQVYGVDLNGLSRSASGSNLEWTQAALAEFERRGLR